MYKKIEFEDFNYNVFNLFKQKHALVTSGTKEDHNTLTVGWGTLGILFREPVAIAYVKPTRHSFKYMENSKYFSICWFDDSEKSQEILKTCGTTSGRDVNKDELCSLTPIVLDNAVAYEEADLIITCEKSYQNAILKENFVVPKCTDLFADGIHHEYVGKILGIYKKN